LKRCKIIGKGRSNQRLDVQAEQGGKKKKRLLRTRTGLKKVGPVGTSKLAEGAEKGDRAPEHQEKKKKVIRLGIRPNRSKVPLEGKKKGWQP